MQRSLVAVALAVVALTVPACDKATDNVEIFQTTLQGSNEVPATGSAASGACGIQIEGNRVLFSIETHGLSNIIGAHIHTAPAGTNGSIRAVFIPFPGSSAVILSGSDIIGSREGLLTSGSFGASDVRGVSFEQLLSEIRAGNTYCNVHTTRFPGGEIRGQLQQVSLD
jgi:hypothetical protein